MDYVSYMFYVTVAEENELAVKEPVIFKFPFIYVFFPISRREASTLSAYIPTAGTNISDLPKLHAIYNLLYKKFM